MTSHHRFRDVVNPVSPKAASHYQVTFGKEGRDTILGQSGPCPGRHWWEFKGRRKHLHGPVASFRFGEDGQDVEQRRPFISELQLIFNQQ